jgi:lipopolysaccharide transport system permease protein
MDEINYTPVYPRGNGINSWKQMFQNLLATRELIWRLMARDIRVRYRQTVLGYIWAVLPPILTVLVFSYLTSRRVINMGQTVMPYVVHALWSLSVWQLFAAAVVNCTHSLVNAGNLVTRIKFPKEAVVIAALGQPVIDFFIRLIPFMAVCYWYNFIPSAKIILVPLLLSVILMMATAIGLMASLLNLVFRDIGNMIGMALTVGVFLAPVLYPPPVDPPFNLVNTLNPFSPILIASQNCLTGGPIANFDYVIFVSVMSIPALVLGLRVFYITLPRICERA